MASGVAGLTIAPWVLIALPSALVMMPSLVSVPEKSTSGLVAALRN